MTLASHQITLSRKVALLLGLFIAVLGVSVLVGWVLDIAALKNIFPGLVTMKANTAAGMLLCGSALALLSREKAGNPIRLLTMVIATVVIALGVLTLCEYLLGWDLGIDQLFFHDVADPTETSQPGRMSPATAFCFLLAGCSLLMASRPATMRLRLPILAALGLSVIVISGFALIGYITDALFGLLLWNYTGMAVHAAVGFLLLGCGLLALIRSEGGLVWSLDALTVGGFAVGIVSLATAAGISYHFTNELQQSAAWVSHTQEVLKEIEEVSAGVAAIGSSERNYINTGNELLLEQEGGIKDTIQENLDILRKLTADNPHQKPRLDQLGPLIAQRIDWGEQTVAARRQGGLSAAEQIIAAGRGIALSDNIRHVITEMEDEEYSLLDQRQKKEQAISSTTFLLLPLGVFISITMLSLGLFFLNTGVAERARAEEKVYWLASFPERNPNPIVELDLASGVVHYANPSAIRLFPNLQREGGWHPLLTGLQETQKTLLGEKTGTVRREISTGEFFFSQTITYIPETRRLRVYSTDITERMQAEERLKASFKEIGDLKAALDEHAIVAITDAQGKITYVNDKFCAISKYSREELLGQDHRIINSGFHPKEFIRNLWTTIANGKVWKGEIKNRAKDGSYYWVDTTIVPFLNNDGKPRQYIAIRADITERKRAEEAQSRLAAIVNSSDDAIIGKTLEGIITSWNPGAQKVFGYAEAEAVGKPMLMLFPPERSGEEPEILARIARGETVDHIETVRVRKDGGLIDVSATISPIRDESGKIIGASKIARDITERKQAQEKINQLNVELEQRVIQRTAELEVANKELEAFSYSVSHDLRAPLRAVNGFAGIVLQDFSSQLPEEGKRYLERIRDGGKRMGELIDDLLAFSRLSRQLVNPQPVNTARLVQNVVDELKPAWDGRRIEIKTDELPACHGDPALLKQVWVNLVSNAVKYTREREPAIIEIGCTRENGENVYFVRDNGAGFDMQYAHKLFGVFQRLHRADEFEGTGVGLAIVQRIIHRHGGRIWPQAAVGRGATFYFTLEGKNKP
jgi:PAS domain S-box-containing protein